MVSLHKNRLAFLWSQSHFTVPSPKHLVSAVESRWVKQHVPQQTAVELEILSSHLTGVTLKTIKSWSCSHLSCHAHACPCSSWIFMETLLGNRYLTSTHHSSLWTFHSLLFFKRSSPFPQRTRTTTLITLFVQPGKKLACPLYYQLLAYFVVQKNLHENVRPSFT